MQSRGDRVGNDKFMAAFSKADLSISIIRDSGLLKQLFKESLPQKGIGSANVIEQHSVHNHDDMF